MTDQPERTSLIDAPELLIKAMPSSPPWLACDLEVVGVAELVGTLIAARRTGRLEITDAAGARSLFFESGEFTGASSTHSADRLGEVLWRAGRLTLDQLMIAAEQVKEGKMIGRALVELGFLQPGELRRALVDQAVQVFQAACVEETGYAIFRAELFHKNPIRFGVSTKKLVESAVASARGYRELLRKLGSLDRPVDMVTPVAKEPLDERATAVLQLVASARKKELTGREVIAKANLARVEGARALLMLVEVGCLRMRASAADEALRIKRLCAAINLAMAALDDAGFGVGAQVREHFDNPPPAFAEALANLTLEQPINEGDAVEQAKFIAGSQQAMIKALEAVLDDALLQAADTLPELLTQKVRERVKALGV